MYPGIPEVCAKDARNSKTSQTSYDASRVQVRSDLATSAGRGDPSALAAAAYRELERTRASTRQHVPRGQPQLKAAGHPPGACSQTRRAPSLRISTSDLGVKRIMTLVSCSALPPSLPPSIRGDYCRSWPLRPRRRSARSARAASWTPRAPRTWARCRSHREATAHCALDACRDALTRVYLNRELDKRICRASRSV